jgi:hypothetical protein
VLRETRTYKGANTSEAGYFSLMLVVGVSLIATAVLTAAATVATSTRDVRRKGNHVTARLAARSGIAEQVADIVAVRDMAPVGEPFSGLDSIDSNPLRGAGGFTATASGRYLADHDGAPVAQYDVFVDSLPGSSISRRLAISAYAYVPDKATYDSGAPDAARADAHAVVEVRFQGSEVFDYSYFINHWGWFFGDDIVSNGNVRSNGQFDFGHHTSAVNGSPRYEASHGTQLLGYLDDNGDGIKDGSDGGVYSSVSIMNAGNVDGIAAASSNRHVTPDVVEMPNLDDLSFYEERALARGSSIAVGDSFEVDGVLGDGDVEPQNLYLVGTREAPVILNGSVVVRGSVIISGYVSGQGSIYAGGNIYVADDLLYLNPPDSIRPDSNDQESVENWRSDSSTRDSLGLFAREHIVVGDYTADWWQSNVSAWINHDLNKSREDAGSDGIQNTREGPDGVLGTADDDLLEDDGVWTVNHYTEEDAERGLIPEGSRPGDVIPGSGEDIDGDGRYDDTTRMSEFDLSQPLSRETWAGNLQEGEDISYSQVSSAEIARLDAAFYTNHTFAAVVSNPNGAIQVNGSVVSRNESIIYAADGLELNHDERLTGRGSPQSGFDSPLGWDPVRFIHWDFDRILPDEVIASTERIADYLGGISGGGE